MSTIKDILQKLAIFCGLCTVRILLFLVERLILPKRTKTIKEGMLNQKEPPMSERQIDKNPGFIEPCSDDDIQSEGWLRSWLKWCPTSMSILRQAEKKILSYVKNPFRGHYINVGPVVGKDDCKIWTLSFTENEQEKTPLVMLHGLGAGVALWALNFDGLSKHRPVHAIDLLGFGRSSRPAFSTDALDAEREFVQSIEEWRREMKLERFVLLGHSMGGFLATSYAIRYPSRVSHLILADPWGFPEKPADLSQRYPIPLWVKMIAYVLQPLNPLWGIRVAGPMGPKLIEKVRPDLIKKFSALNEDGDGRVADYIFHCNAQAPSGEAAFHSMMSSFGWAKYPMINRIPSLKQQVPMTMIYGSRSWVDHCPGGMIQQMRPNSFVDVQIVRGAGHHVYADAKDQFNELVLAACDRGDKNDVVRFEASQNSPEPTHSSEDNPALELNLSSLKLEEKPVLKE